MGKLGYLCVFLFASLFSFECLLLIVEALKGKIWALIVIGMFGGGYATLWLWSGDPKHRDHEEKNEVK